MKKSSILSAIFLLLLSNYLFAQPAPEVDPLAPKVEPPLHSFETGGETYALENALHTKIAPGDWEPTSKSEYTLDGDGNRVEELQLNWTDGEWTPARKTLREYDENGNATGYDYFEYADGEWNPVESCTYTLDGDGSVTNESRAYWSGVSWIFYRERSFVYEDGKLIEQVTRALQQGEMRDVDKVVYVYDEKGNNTQFTIYVYSGDEWVFHQKEIASFDDQNRKTGAIRQSWTGDAWAEATKKVYAYGHNDSLQTLTNYYALDGDWKIQDFSMYTYDAENRVTGLIVKRPVMGYLQTVTEYEIEYNEDGNRSKRTIYAIDGPDKHAYSQTDYEYSENGLTVETNSAREFVEWADYSKTSYVFDDNSRAVEYIVEYGENSRLLNEKHKITYDENGAVEQKTVETMVGDSWIPSVRVTIQYGDDGAILNNTFERHNKLDWEATGEHTYEYDEEGKLTTFTTVSHLDGGIDYRYTYEYDESGEPLSAEIEAFDFVSGGFAPFAKIDYQTNYDGVNAYTYSEYVGSETNPVYKVEYIYGFYSLIARKVASVMDHGNWTLYKKSSFTYDDETLEEELVQIYNGHLWQDRERIAYEYGTYSRVGDSDAFDASVEMYPNPTSDKAVLSLFLEAPQRTVVEVYDLNGRPVKTVANDFLPAGLHNIVIKLGGVPAGAYYVRISGGASDITKTVIINE